MSASKTKIFISFTTPDAAWAKWVAWVLTAEGYAVTIQTADFSAGMSFVRLMQEALDASDHVVAIYSPDYFRSDFAASEWQAAFAKDPIGSKRTLMPVRVAPCDPPSLLAVRVYIDLVGLDEPDAQQELWRGIRGEATNDRPSFPGATDAPKPPFPEAPSIAPGLQESATLVYANKYAMPARFWRDLYCNAAKRFVLVGRSNKSWISRSQHQTAEFASNLNRIVSGGGSVHLVSIDELSIKAQTADFLSLVLQDPAGATTDELKQRLRYSVVSGTNYQAVMSDEELVILPMMNSSEFREETLVIRLTRSQQEAAFVSYQEDIARLTHSGQRVDWV
ncbi:MAG: toll/interleukin-1 receptor domain-containing protein [bacterium]|nr:toll/interleukin-1 receptor domain-containing protein [bacterium]